MITMKYLLITLLFLILSFLVIVEKFGMTNINKEIKIIGEAPYNQSMDGNVTATVQQGHFFNPECLNYTSSLNQSLYESCENISYFHSKMKRVTAFEEKAVSQQPRTEAGGDGKS